MKNFKKPFRKCNIRNINPSDLYKNSGLPDDPKERAKFNRLRYLSRNINLDDKEVIEYLKLKYY